MATYDPLAQLSAVEAVAAGAASAGAQEQIFLFASGRYLGTVTAEPRVASSFETNGDGSITVTYGHFAPSDPFCCPSLEPWTVTLRWIEDELVTSGYFPPLDQGLGEIGS